MALYTIFPFGEYRADIRQAMTSQILANVHRGKNQRPFKIDDFMIGAKKRKRKRKRMSGGEIMSFLKGLGRHGDK